MPENNVGHVCDVCGKPATCVVSNVRVIPGKPGDLWETTKIDGPDKFGCADHIPETEVYEEDGVTKWQ